MRRAIYLLAIRAGAAALLVVSASVAQQIGDLSSGRGNGTSIERCLVLAERNFPKILEAKARKLQKDAQVDQARYAPFSEFTLSGGLALAPTLRGTSQYSLNTDRALTNNMGVAWQVGIDGALPLYTFGKMKNAVEAAEAAARVGSHEIEKERNEVRLNVRRAYYGVQLARDAIALVREASSKIDSQIEKMKQQVADGEGDDIQLLRIQVFRADLTVRESEAEKQETVALAGLRFLTGEGDSLDVVDEPLVPISHDLGTLSEYLDAASRHRPELAMALAGVAARQASLRLEKSKLFPDVGLGMSAKWTYAPEVTDQTNPFVRDDGNRFGFGIGLVVRQKLDFLPQSARISFARAQLEEVQATRQWALGGIAQQVKDAFAEVKDCRRRLSAMSSAAQLAKQWMLKVQQGIEVGTMEDEDIVLPAREYATKRFGEMAATYEFNVALAKLAQVTGVEQIVQQR